jgi:serine/threonine protein phosphatase 1
VKNNIGRVFVLGDVHGAYRALIQCLVRGGFDYNNDHLICLGDVCDGWPETRRCLAELLKIRHLTYILGNHDTWFRSWMKTGTIENIWYLQGGEATLDSYAGTKIPPEHLSFLENALPYFTLDGKLFVHAGIDPSIPLEDQTEEIFLWDRGLAKSALQYHRARRADRLTIFDEVYLGHTPIPYGFPVCGGGVWLMDTGAGWNGVLSMMDINSHEVFTSDLVPELYPGVQGRGKR